MSAIVMGNSELVDQGEIASRLGYHPEWVRRLHDAGELPAALGELSGGKVWRWAPVRRWAISTGRLDVDDRGDAWRRVAR